MGEGCDERSRVTAVGGWLVGHDGDGDVGHGDARPGEVHFSDRRSGI